MTRGVVNARIRRLLDLDDREIYDLELEAFDPELEDTRFYRLTQLGQQFCESENIAIAQGLPACALDASIAQIDLFRKHAAGRGDAKMVRLAWRAIAGDVQALLICSRIMRRHG